MTDRPALARTLAELAKRPASPELLDELAAIDQADPYAPRDRPIGCGLSRAEARAARTAAALAGVPVARWVRGLVRSAVGFADEPVPLSPAERRRRGR